MLSKAQAALAGNVNRSNSCKYNLLIRNCNRISVFIGENFSFSTCQFLTVRTSHSSTFLAPLTCLAMIKLTQIILLLLMVLLLLQLTMTTIKRKQVYGMG